ncbi:LPD1 domain-containing protein (plasmid) [Alkalihalophilus sp. As8PL]|uniref:LPD1 domain-containing protein n=1 Tax=Alkalihalophilus sp. As8PL TaxID=3237103 RepID=A0AB39BNL8_9BACI
MQLSLFDLNNPSKTMGTSKGKVKDIRTIQQAQHKVSYDVGEKIGGAMKDLVKSRFEDNPNIKTLGELEKISGAFAESIVTKKAVFESFSLEDEKEKEVDVKIALIKEALLKRVDKQPTVKDAEGRKKYLLACQELLEILEGIEIFQELEIIIHRVGRRIGVEKTGLKRLEDKLEDQRIYLERYKSRFIPGTQNKNIEAIENRIKQIERDIRNYEDYKTKPLSCLGETFCSFFTKPNSANQTWKRICEKKPTWEEVLKSPKKTVKKKKKNTWGRELPDKPERVGGRTLTVGKPEDLLREFNFRACEFGHYVDDSSAMNHLTRSAEAFYDLADILGIHHTAVSLGGKLAIAFGSRGRGRALAHYEPVGNVINLTKKRGSLGVLAHEWFHALDRYLFLQDSGSIQLGYASESSGDVLRSEIRDVMERLDNSIMKGEGLEYCYNTNAPETRWTISSKLQILYQSLDGDLNKMLNKYLEQVDARRKFFNETYPTFAFNKEEREKKERAATRKEKRELNKYVNAMCWYHEKQTGERVDRLAIPSDNSNYYLNALTQDRGQEGKYWSSRVELYARAFETYIQDKLKEANRVSDYLVAGTNHTQAYPQGEERKSINLAMDQLLKVLANSVLSVDK